MAALCAGLGLHRRTRKRKVVWFEQYLSHAESSPAKNHTRRRATVLGERNTSPLRAAAFAPVDKKERKKTAGGTSLKGAVARIADPVDGEFLLVGESWVTTRTAMDATGLPGWSVFGTPGLTSFDPPDTVKAILFLAENDADGKNAKALAIICPKLFERGNQDWRRLPAGGP